MIIMRRFPPVRLLGPLLASLAATWIPAPAAVWAVWEQSPLCAETRLPADAAATWEFALLLTADAVNPSDLTVPAGVRVILHLQNLSASRMQADFRSLGRSVLIPPAGYRRLDLGPLSPGEHEFRLTSPGAPGSREIGRVWLRAGTWPRTAEPLYRAAWIVHSDALLPRVLTLPAGRPSEIAIGGTSDLRPALWKIPGGRAEFIPGRITRVSTPRPRSGRIPVLLRGKAPSILVVR